MSERRAKRRVEFIESYWTGGFYGSDYVWDDNHGELVRCKDCIYKTSCEIGGFHLLNPDWFCADGKRREDDG